jgi:hypothetical protein
MGEAERREEKKRRCKPDTARGGLVDEKKADRTSSFFDTVI